MGPSRVRGFVFGIRIERDESLELGSWACWLFLAHCLDGQQCVHRRSGIAWKGVGWGFSRFSPHKCTLSQRGRE